jgi:ribosomal RNA-processing protein 8
VNEEEFIKAFKEVQEREFPKVKKYKKINMVGLSASLKGKQRSEILKRFEKNGNDVMIISSCETIGEGIDTKNANMCVFVDPKTSYVKIIQNIGRIVRKIFGEEKPNSTVLIPCWVDKEKYLGCGGDKEKCDEVIRQDMSEGGNFNGILNVLSALKQEDEEIYDLCLHYPDSYSPQEISNHLEKHGYTIGEPGELNEVLETLLDTDLESDDLMEIAEEEDVCIEVYTHSLENPVETYNPEAEEIVRVYQTEEGEFCPVTKRSDEGSDKEKRTSERIPKPDREHRVNIKVHTHPDIKVLWNITSDITGDICSCIIDCEVVKYDPMEAAIGIVERAKERVAKGGNFLPIRTTDKSKRIGTLDQQNKDNQKLADFKKALKGKGNGKCSNNVRDYLDEYLLGWRMEIDLDEKAMKDAIDIVERAKERVLNGGKLLPRHLHKSKRTTQEIEQENKDACKINAWKGALKGEGCNCSDEVRDYLDKELPGWRTNLDEQAMKKAEGIVERAKERVKNGFKLLPRQLERINITSEILEQEYKDACKISAWKQALKESKNSRCSDEVRDYLDKELSGWRTNFDEQAMKKAEGIVERAKERVKNGGKLLPRNISKKETEILEQEYKDASKLCNLKRNLKNKYRRCSDEVRDYLDKELPGWRTNFDEKAIKEAECIVERANERVLNGGKLLPRFIKNTDRINDVLKQENKDYAKLGTWKGSLKGYGHQNCSEEVREYLDENLLGWRTEIDWCEKAIKDAEYIVERASERLLKGGKLLPQQISKRETEELEQEYKDACKIRGWKQALKGKGDNRCPDQVRDYLDEHLPGWRTEVKSMKAKEPKEPTVPKESYEQKRLRVQSEISLLHKEYKTLTSENLGKLFNENKDLWHIYHAISEENERSFPEEGIPRNRIIHELNKINTKRTRTVVDMGCGKAQISQHFKSDTRFKFINYDHISSNETVISCDISKIPLEDASVEICILSLAMWGSNCKSYLSEACRLLESGGKLYMIEPTKRWTDTTNADRLQNLLKESGFQIIQESIEKFCLFECIKK